MNSQYYIQNWLENNQVINLSGTMTALGASLVPESISNAIKDSLNKFIDIDALQAEASKTISKSTGAEAGCITACVASGICNSIAAAMTGVNLGLAEELPNTDKIDKTEVVILKGHVVSYGSNINQKIKLAGANPVEVGTSTAASIYQLRHSISEKTCAALWVVSHHTVQSGLLDLKTFVKICHENYIPVIVDAASEYDLRAFIQMGVDVVIYSGHKFLSGPTSGIVAGKASLVKAIYMHQCCGIGRAMKVGKESVVGSIAALERWQQMDHLGLHKLEYQRLIKIRECLTNIKGLIIEEHADPTGNPITRLRIYIDHNVSGLDIGKLVKALRSGSPPIIVRDHHIDLGYFEIDPCNMKDGDPEIVISFFKDLQPLLLNCTPEFKENNTLGPRNSRYDNKGIPVINLSEVPFTYHRDIDREDHFKKWPESFQKNASTEN